MRVLLTRPHFDSLELAATLRTHGIATTVEPLLKIQYINGPALDMSGVKALLVTSANGLRAFVNRSDERSVPIYAVGDATAHEAAIAGFKLVSSAAGTVSDLANLVIESVKPGEGSLLHPAGTIVAGDLAGRLTRHGHVYRREVLYSAEATSVLSVELRNDMASGAIDGVLLYSPRTAGIFVQLVEEAGLHASLRQMTAFCLSPAVAEVIAAITWGRIIIAAQPEQSKLLEMLINPPI